MREKIAQIRKEFNEEFKVEEGLGSTPNLGIANFMQYAFKEESIIKKFKVIAIAYPHFKLELKVFGSFPQHPIFLNVTSKLPVENLVKEVKTQTQVLMKLNKETKPHFFDQLHITIAMKLKPWQYEKGWLAYSNKHFTSRFIADAMLLLKRPQGEKSWQIAARFDFQNLHIPAIKQGDLFC